MLYLFLTLLLGMPVQGLAQNANLYESYRPRPCSSSPSPLFQNLKDPLETLLMADFKDNLLANEEKARSTAVMAVRLSEQLWEVNRGELRTRGKSRMKLCKDMRPLKFVFLSQQIYQVSDRDELINIMKEIWLYEDLAYRELLSETNRKRLIEGKAALRQIMLEGQSVDGTFDKLGDDIKMVTHCGIDEQWFYDRDDEAGDQYVIKEYFAYRSLDFLKTINPKARLSKMHYFSPTGEKIDSKYAFFREPFGKTARRCHLKKSEIRGPRLMNQDFFKLQQSFLINGDFHIKGHNVAYLNDKFGRTYLMPYDYDLSRFVIRKTILKQNDRLYQALKKTRPRLAAISYGFFLLNSIDSMIEEVAQGVADSDQTELMRLFLEGNRRSILRFFGEMQTRALSDFNRIKEDYRRWLENS